ncbi:unnamed protein product [Lepeophtheirus salmonis]|uniref:(salmon louse) hypothetical protein n=1 Tax=Lepeophtheirus salmonis TaxID=72036 RepID=A0A7R8GZV3_LEPSM|nr:unnamed protein product [Lepeophtheirus salmonis]CAF2774220.1 unnamed protein product [Lepeophtheirus salmonis]
METPCSFQAPMTKERLFEIINEIEVCGIKIFAVIFDLGNKTFLSQFGLIKPSQFTFPIPHDPRYIIPNYNGKSMRFGKKHFEELMHIDCGVFKVAWEMTENHIECKGIVAKGLGLLFKYSPRQLQKLSFSESKLLSELKQSRERKLIEDKEKFPSVEKYKLWFSREISGREASHPLARTPQPKEEYDRAIRSYKELGFARPEGHSQRTSRILLWFSVLFPSSSCDP